jgi:hypothetical protein
MYTTWLKIKLKNKVAVRGQSHGIALTTTTRL